MKRSLFITHRAPYSSESPQEQLDALLVSAAFGQTVSVLFQGDGVWQLLAQQEGRAVERRTLSAQLQALPLYEVQHIYADAESLKERGLRGTPLILNAKVLDAPALKTLISEQNIVLRF